ncbi:MAG TPA: SulP family inorganic anion transporter [Methylibium sp.]|nr:SulP family inorganic anion transporter [Methylibium sp.]
MAAREEGAAAVRPSGNAPGRGVLRADLIGGGIAAAVMLAIEGSYGMIALAPLGPGLIPYGFMMGIYTSALANLVMALTGARGPLLTGTSAPLALLVPPLLAGLMLDERLRRPDGSPDTALLLAFLVIGVVLAGLTMAAVGALRAGRLIRYIPYTVHAGFTAGVALVMVFAITPQVLGLPLGTAAAAGWAQARPGAVAVALVTLWVAVRPPRWTLALPRFLTALLVGAALQLALAAVAPAALGPVLGKVELALLAGDAVPALRALVEADLWRPHAGLLLQFAVAVVLIGGLQSMLAAAMVDSLIRQRSDSGRVLMVQGLVNVAVGLGGGLPSAGAASRSKLNLDAGSIGALSRVAFALALVLAAGVGAGLLQHLPLAVVAGLFLATAWSLVDPWTRQATAHLLRGLRAGSVPRALLANYAVMATVTLVSGFVSLAHGIAAGVLLAMVNFVRANSRHPIRAVASGAQRRSLKVRDAAANALLAAQGERIALVELDGALFFGTADLVATELGRVGRQAEDIVVECRRLTEVDASGARILVQAADDLRRAGRRLRFASLDAAGEPAALVREMDVHGTLADSDFLPDADRALEAAEDALLARLAPPPTAAAGPLRLADTLLGSGLAPDELAALQAVLVERRCAAGEMVFRRGDAGDALYVALAGEIGIWLAPADGRGAARRIVSFAPGVVFGEMGLLQGQRRSADAVAAEDAVLLELSVAALERLAAERPTLHAKLLRNLSRQLADRVRGLTGELQAAWSLR